MSSYTSSSDFRASKWPLRFALCLAACLVLIAVCNVYFSTCEKVARETEERQLTACKVYNGRRYDVIALGSSRMNFGIDPATMAAELPGLSIYNCAMFGGAVNAEILDYAENRKIDWNSPRPRIVLMEFSPRVFSRISRRNGSYRAIMEKSPDEISRLLSYSRDRMTFLDLFMPMSRDRWNGRGKMKKETTVPYCHVESGWYEVVDHGIDVEASTRKYVANMRSVSSEGYDVDASLSETLARVRAWTSRGVLVYGVEPPTYPEVKILETKRAGYDRERAIAEFRKAGGRFIPLKKSYRVKLAGSHLDSLEAKQFSREVAAFIRKDVEQRGIWDFLK